MLALDGSFQAVEIFDAEFRPHQLQGLRAEPGDLGQLEEGRGIALAKGVELGHRPRVEVLPDLCGGGLADALDLRELGG